MKKLIDISTMVNDWLIGIVATAIIGGTIAFIFWGGKNWVTNLQKSLFDIKTLLDDVKRDISEVRLDNQLTRSAVQELDSNINLKITSAERKIDRLEKKFEKVDDKVNDLERGLKIIKIAHHRNYPEDEI